MVQSPAYQAFKLYNRLMERAERCRRFSYPHPLQTPEPRDQINYGWWRRRAERFEYWASVIYKRIDV